MMTPGRLTSVLRWPARLGLGAAVLAITWLALTPQPDPPGLGWDKLNHVAAFLVLAALAQLGWPGRRARWWRLGLLLGYGLAIELVQGVLDYRQGSVLDFAADALGVALWHGLRLVLMQSPALSPAAADGRPSAPADSRDSPGESPRRRR